MIFRILLSFLLLHLFVFGFGQPCVEASFRRKIFSEDEIKATHQIPTSDGGHLLTGKWAAVTAPDFAAALAIKFGANGRQEWSLSYSVSNAYKQVSVQQGLQRVAGEYVLACKAVTQAGQEDLLLMQLNASGKVEWASAYSPASGNSVVNRMFLTGISEGRNGDLLITGSVADKNSADAPFKGLLLRISKQGKLIYSYYSPDTNHSLHTFIGALVQENELVLWSFLDDGACPGLDTRALQATRIGYESGEVLATRKYCFPSERTTSYTWWPFSFMAAVTQNGYGIAGHLAEGSNRNVVMMQFDNDLNFIGGRVVGQVFAGNSMPHNNIAPDGSLVTLLRKSGVAPALFYSKVSLDGPPIRQKMYALSAGNYDDLFTNGGRRITANGSTTSFVLNYRNGAHSVIEWVQESGIHTPGNACSGVDTSFSRVDDFAVYETPHQWNALVPALFRETFPEVEEQKVVLHEEEVCNQQSSCLNLKILGRDTVCVAGQDADFTARINPECRKKVIWEVLSPFVQSSSAPNDSTLRLRFKLLDQGPQTVFISAAADGCPTANDTVQVTLLPAVTILPKDTVVCGKVTMRLSAGNCFKTYLWQDGSTDSVFNASRPGIFWVRVQSYCGQTITDSIQIDEAEQDFIQEESVRLCFGDTAHIRLLKSNYPYKWQPSSPIIAVSDTLVHILTNQATLFRVSASPFPGCIVTDSVAVQVHDFSPLHLGNDTVICTNSSLLLNAGSGYLSYLWNTGSGQQKLWVNSSGLYAVQVTDSNGCVQRAQIHIREKACGSSSIWFPNAFTANSDGLNDRFRPSVTGSLNWFELKIYNRWGQAVFHSADPNKGWNGQWNGRLQSGSFVWVCTFRFSDGEPQVRRGIVTVIR